VALLEVGERERRKDTSAFVYSVKIPPLVMSLSPKRGIAVEGLTGTRFNVHPKRGMPHDPIDGILIATKSVPNQVEPT